MIESGGKPKHLHSVVLRIMRSSHVRVLRVLQDTSELRELGMRMDGDRARLVIHYGDIRLMLIADRTDMELAWLHSPFALRAY